MPESIEGVVRARVVYHGNVQGVGFRATAHFVARNFAVVGYVRNLADGTVELEAEGATSEVNRFLAALEGRMASNIADAVRSARTPLGREKCFEIAR